ncbi:MAG TPA: lytic murein transglycosylase [Marmoricola sp.]|nr:lytic murein transglycosylase [Marmoricola sp.]
MHPRSSSRVVLGVVAGVLLLVAALGLAILRVGSGARPDAAAATSLPVAPASAPDAEPRPVDQSPSRSAARPLVDQGWLNRTAAAAGIPAPALRAYAAAELVVRAEQPACHLSWNTLAGIGWVESQHGTVGGRTLGADGRSSQPVLGPALDGAAGLAAIHSTGASAPWHGDSVWEHAVGPLQFLASTWSRWGADGDGDGTADPMDIDDAALAAARYLCADGHDLATGAGWNAAVHSYNHDAAYVARVAAAAGSYAARVATTR